MSPHLGHCFRIFLAIRAENVIELEIVKQSKIILTVITFLLAHNCQTLPRRMLQWRSESAFYRKKKKEKRS